MKLNEVIETLVSQNTNLSEEEKKQQIRVLEELVYHNKIPADTLNIDSNAIEFIYDFASQLYRQGKYEQSIGLFTMLTGLDPLQYRFYMGLGSCYQKKQDWIEALKAFYTAYFINTKDPIPAYQIADCMLKLDSPNEAYIALQMTIQRAGNNPIFSFIKNRAELMYDSLKEQLKSGEIEEDVPKIRKI